MILLTGSSGFVGSSVANFFSGDSINVVKRDGEIEVGLSNVVIHLAGKAHDLKYASNPNEYYKVNTELTKTVFDAFLASDAKAPEAEDKAPTTAPSVPPFTAPAVAPPIALL